MGFFSPHVLLDVPRSLYQKPSKCHRMLSDCSISIQDPEKHFRSPFWYSALAILLEPTENRRKRGGCLVFPRQGLRSLIVCDSRQIVKSLSKTETKRLFKTVLALRTQLRGINRALLFLDQEMAQQVKALVEQARLLEFDAWNLNKGKEREQSCSLTCTCAHSIRTINKKSS